MVLRTDISQNTATDKTINNKAMFESLAVFCFLRCHIKTPTPSSDNNPISCIIENGNVSKK